MHQRQPQRGVLKAGLAVILLGIVAYGCIGLTPASSGGPSSTTAAVVPGQSGPTPATTVDVTTGPSKTKKPKRSGPDATSASAQPTEEPTSALPTTAPTDSSLATSPPTDMPSTPISSGLHLRSLILSSFIIQPLDPKLDYQ